MIKRLLVLLLATPLLSQVLTTSPPGGGGGGGGGAPLFPVNAQTASYTTVAGDFSSCKLITMNSASALTLTLLATAPAAGQCVLTEDIGAGVLTVSPNGRTVDGSAANITLSQNQGILITSDGTNYSTNRGIGGGFANPMTTLGDLITGGTSGAATRLAGPTTPNSVAELLCSTPSGGVATAQAWCLAGVGGRTVSTTDTVLATDRATWLLFNSASAFTETLPQAGTAGFTSNFSFCFSNIGAGIVTLTPTTSTIDGQASISIQNGQNGCIASLDNINYNSRLAGNSRQASAGTNFGTALTTQTVMGLVSVTGNVSINSSVQQSTLGVGCGAGTNTMSITWSYTAPGGTAKTTSGDSLNITANGALDSVSNGSSVQISAKQGTAITYTTASTLASAGCTTTPQYTVYTKVVQ